MGSFCSKKLKKAVSPQSNHLHEIISCKSPKDSLLAVQEYNSLYPSTNLINIIPASPSKPFDEPPLSPNSILHKSMTIHSNPKQKNLLARIKNSRNSLDSLTPVKSTSEKVQNFNQSSNFLDSQIQNSDCTSIVSSRANSEVLNLFSELSASSVIQTNLIIQEKSLQGQKKINQYTIVAQIGTGAFGKVFRVQAENGEFFAAKVYKKFKLKSRWIGKKKTALSLVKSEIEIMSNLKHENILQLLEVIDDEDSKKIYLILELAEKGDLHEKSPMGENELRGYFKGLISGLDYLHNEALVVHRDIKPKNLLIGEGNVLKICDFGGAQLIELERDELTNSAGTYIFMPPEAHKGGHYHGKPADIWACGITLFYMLTGKSPFNTRRFSDMCDHVKESEILFPETFSAEVIDLIKKMTMKEPSERISALEIKSHPWFGKIE